jgi:hypothetical protein
MDGIIEKILGGVPLPVLIWSIVGLVLFVFIFLLIALLRGHQISITFRPLKIDIGPKMQLPAPSSDKSENDKRPVLDAHDMPLNSGAILYVNVVGYSTMGSTKQSQVARFLDQKVHELFPIDSQEYPPKSGAYYWYKFNGGDLHVFIETYHNNAASQPTVSAFFKAIALLKSIQSASLDFKIGITIHTGNDLHYTRPSQSSLVADLWGKSLDTVRRMMAFSDGGHFFLSDRALSDIRDRLPEGRLEGSCRTLFQMLEPDQPEAISGNLFEENERFVIEKWEFYDRNRSEHQINNFHTRVGERTTAGNPQRPPDWIQLERRDIAHHTDDPSQRFVRHLIEADEVCIVGLTHESTTGYLATALEARNGKFWQDLQIVFPSERILKEIKETDRGFEARKAKWETSKREIVLFLEGRGSQNLEHWTCRECDENLSFWGNRFVSKDKQVIRIAPLIQGADLKKMPYMTFYKGMNGYDLMSEAFDVLLASSDSIIEWDVLGEYKNETFCYLGIASHAQVGEMKDYCQPVVLVMLNTSEREKNHIVLQRRTFYNAADGYNTYSNISGRLSISDITDSQCVGEFYKTMAKRKHEKGAGLRPQEESSLATELFQKIADWKPAREVELEAWKRAAVREIGEELRFEIKPEDLSYQTSYYFKEKKLFFQIFSLKITMQQFNQIKDNHPLSNLEIISRSDLDQYQVEGKCNRLLQNKYHEVFVSIFDKLDIT